ncbi:DUF4145 domain-containing protein [Embleya sp. NPDC008237]|uniref:DUF4145 domain-containing protein n=1 Tax=Embleya sp. NPDC008237 TaxID=3363978 RepID=UPI0036E86C77
MGWNKLARCGWCEHNTMMRPIPESAVLTSFGPDDGSDPLGWMAYRCEGCQALSLAQGRFARVDFGVPDGGSLWGESWYPQHPIHKTYESFVPERIAEVASEAHGCLSVGHHRAAVALARAVVESTAKAKGIDTGPLVKKIDKLYEQGLIYEHVKDAAHEVREGGNEIAHGDLVDDPIGAEESAAIVELMDMVLDGVFIAPGKTAAQRAARVAREQANQPPAPPTP